VGRVKLEAAGAFIARESSLASASSVSEILEVMDEENIIAITVFSQDALLQKKRISPRKVSND
jgi:hypothetical protein